MRFFVFRKLFGIVKPEYEKSIVCLALRPRSGLVDDLWGLAHLSSKLTGNYLDIALLDCRSTNGAILNCKILYMKEDYNSKCLC